MHTKLTRTAPARYLKAYSVFRLAALLLWAALPAALQARQQPYLPPGRPDSATLLAPPPLPGSAEQAADLAEVIAVHDACASNETAVAFSEKKFSVFNLMPAVGEFFDADTLPKTETFFHRVQKEAAVVADAGKDYWQRPRPFTVEPKLAVGKLEKSFGYPSGHAAEGMTLALVLAEVFPEKRDAILAIGRNLGWHRVCIGRHYLTDIYAGRVLAQAVVRELKASPAFQKDLAEVKAEMAAALAAVRKLK
jgi:acid phosphatase (class A)